MSKPYRVNCRLSGPRRKRLIVISQKFGWKHTPFMEECAFAVIDRLYKRPTKLPIPPEVAEELANTCIQLRKIGTNINQIAEYANTYQKIRGVDRHNLISQVSRMETVIKNTVNTLLSMHDDQIDATKIKKLRSTL